MMKKIAIIIPAYKIRYLEDTLESLCRQTTKEFSVYVGDDASPDDIESVCDRYKDRLSISYHRFEDNLGGRDLVAHWQRCFSLVMDEDWVCLFSDDDMMEESCIEQFYSVLDKNPNVDVFHFDINIIGAHNEVLKTCNAWPRSMNAFAFFKSLYFDYSIDARMPEFIFNKNKLMNKGLIDFDLAWRSDNATVMNVLGPGEMTTVSGPRVLWRASENNISAILNDNINVRKNASTVAFMNWATDFFKAQGIEMPLYHFTHTIVFQLLPSSRSYLSYRKEYTFVKGAIRTCMYYLMVLYRCLRKRIIGDV